MKLIKFSTIALFLASVLAQYGLADEGVHTSSFQQVKLELWSFGPNAGRLGQQERPKQEDQTEVSKLSQGHSESVPEELARALMKYSVEL